MNRRNFLGVSLKAMLVAPVAAIATIVDTPDPLLGKNIPLQLPKRDLEVKVDGVALISNNKIIATNRFRNGSRYLAPGDEMNVRWSCQASNQYGFPIPTERARELFFKQIYERKTNETRISS